MNPPTEDLSHFETGVQPALEPTTLFMVANQDIYVDGLTRIIADQPNLKVVACTSPTNDCYARYAENPTDILMVEQSVIHAKLEKTPADKLFEQFKQLHPELRIIIFGHEMTEAFIRKMLQVGVHGFVDSSSDPELLGTAINEVGNGGHWLSRNSLANLIQAVSEVDQLVEQGITDKIESMKDTLTKRETEVLQRVLEGMSTREIANALHLSEQSIKLHLGHLFKKFEVSNRSQLILMAFKRVCPASNMIQLFRRSLDRHNILRGRKPVIEDLLADTP